jgi:hypothetical protein
MLVRKFLALFIVLSSCADASLNDDPYRLSYNKASYSAFFDDNYLHISTERALTSYVIVRDPENDKFQVNPPNSDLKAGTFKKTEVINIRGCGRIQLYDLTLDT